ncbi:MAG: 1-acyl-sn-glycerol-3-phosphate acyltransferase [Phycisphaerales bacterium]|nr:MAG: 1-acyl-sn-glycerol-3-phosphate acyltransferase [Phycisphaerales bacterium]
MDLVARTLYSSLVCSIRAYQFLFHNLRVWGRENIPQGAKIYVTNHITTHDSFWVLPVFTEPVHIVIGPGYDSPFIARILDSFEQINASPDHRKTVVANAVKYLKKGEAVYLAPEGDMQGPFQLGRFYPGVARMYRETRVPIVPIAVVAPKSCMHEFSRLQTVVDGRVYRTVTVLRGTFCINVGRPMMPAIPDAAPQEQDECILDALKRRMESLVEDVRVNKFWLS